MVKPIEFESLGRQDQSRYTGWRGKINEFAISRRGERLFRGEEPQLVRQALAQEQKDLAGYTVVMDGDIPIHVGRIPRKDNPMLSHNYLVLGNRRIPFDYAHYETDFTDLQRTGILPSGELKLRFIEVPLGNVMCKGTALMPAGVNLANLDPRKNYLAPMIDSIEVLAIKTPVRT